MAGARREPAALADRRAARRRPGRRLRRRWAGAALLVAALAVGGAGGARAAPAPAGGDAARATALPGAAEPSAPPLRVAVVGGILLCGVWDHLAPRIESATGVRLQLAAAAPKSQVLPTFGQGAADLLLIHGGVETFALQAEGLAGAQRVWAANEHVLLGPAEDPAQVRAAPDAAEAFVRIARARAPFVAFRDPGSHEMVQNAWRQAGVSASTAWVLLDETQRPQQILAQAARQHAYVLVGAIPVAFERMRSEGLQVLLRGDPALRRHFVAVEPGPAHPAGAPARAQARAVADFLVSAAGQQALRESDAQAGGPWLFPLGPTLRWDGPAPVGRPAAALPGASSPGAGRRQAP